MKVSDLRAYRDNSESIEQIRRRLERMQNKAGAFDMVQGSKGAPTYAKTVRHVGDGYPASPEANRLIAKMKALEAENAGIEDYIFSVGKSRIFDALFLYCIDESLQNPTWEEVADIMGVDNHMSLQKAVARYMAKASAE